MAARAALEKHAEDLVVLDLRSLSSVADFFVVCTAGSTRQIDALKDHLEGVLSRYECPVWHTEGAASGTGAFNEGPQWVLMDFGEIVVHLLDQQTRKFYRLEDLWGDAPRVPLPREARGPSAQPGISHSTSS